MMFTLLFIQRFSLPETVANVCETVITINDYNTSVVILTFTDSNILCEFWGFCSSEAFGVFAAVKLGLLLWDMTTLHQ